MPDQEARFFFFCLDFVVAFLLVAAVSADVEAVAVAFAVVAVDPVSAAPVHFHSCFPSFDFCHQLILNEYRAAAHAQL